MAENKTLRLLMPKWQGGNSLLEAHLLNSNRMLHLKKYLAI